MLYCPLCGCPLKENSTHCLECGEAIDLRPLTPAPPTYVPEVRPVMTIPQSVPQYPLNPGPAFASEYPLSAGPVAAMPALVPDPPLLKQWIDSLRQPHPQTYQRPKVSLVGLIVRIVYFFGIGLWMSQLWVLLAWFLSLTIIGLPLALHMMRVLPQITLLMPHSTSLPALSKTGGDRVPFPIRVIYFFLFGWWLSLVWLEIAWLFGISVVGMPVALTMFAFTPQIATLGRR